MQHWMPGMIRHIFQHHIRWQDPVFRAKFVDLLELDEDEVEALEDFTNQVACHVLERLLD